MKQERQKQEKAIKDYFQAWINKDSEKLSYIFSDDVIYSECYGPEYHGLQQILCWFSEWNKSATVLEWSIKSFIHQENITVAEWYFKCDYNSEISGFDGVSIVEFNDSNRIIKIKEFQSKSEHSYPYRDKCK